MKKYYATFGQTHKTETGILLKDYWVLVMSCTIESAKEKMFERYGLNWSNIYDEDDFDKSYHPNGEYEKIQ